jgi:hypothetical protein
MKEKEIEQYLVKRVKTIGGKAFKFVSPGNNGVPDRMVCLPEGRIIFAELKATGCKTRPSQDQQIKKLYDLGFDVYVIDSKEMIDQLIRQWNHEDF